MTILTTFIATHAALAQPAPPPTPREFRGIWVASVANIDWPSARGLAVEQQKAQLLSILDRSAAARLNAVILQVRPAADALYASRLEPWSEYLSGTMGLPPSPEWDPLAFAVAEAHRRGLELHAWINPFRARHSSAKGPASAGHVSQANPAIVRDYGRLQWLDPGLSTARRHSLDVVLDMVRRYDLDGLHMDDYFYPYREKNAAGKLMDFPDEASFKAYRKSGGRLSLSDWRRQNINTFVESVYRGVKKVKPWVKVGISPFGIWRPGHPKGVTGFDAYDNLYADARLWLRNGWLDYLTPQLYWKTEAPGQPFGRLLTWWEQQNTRKRHLWPGLNASNGSSELITQLGITRRTVPSDGVILWHAASVLNRPATVQALSAAVFQEDALPPASPWLSGKAPPAPTLVAPTEAAPDIEASWALPPGRTASRWVFKTKEAERWTVRVLPSDTTSMPLLPNWQAVSIQAVDRFGNESPAAVARRAEP